jgi:pimeloyl-ACP methyl ester carboxylesterase
MKRMFSLPAIGLMFSLILANKISSAQSYFTAEVKGKGKPMILIHGLYCTGEVWKETVERYQKDYECHIITLSGFGGSAPNLNDHFLESVKDDLLAYVKKEKIKKPILVGHSMGGFLSFWAAASAPGTFEKVIAVDGLPFMTALQMPNATAESAKPMAANNRDMLGTLTPDGIKASQKMYLPTMITSAERIEQIADMASKADSKTQGQVMYELYTTDLRPLVSKIDCPVMLMGAWIAYSQYGVTRESILSSYTKQVAEVKEATVEISDKAKHFIFYDDPAWFYEKIDAFIAKK